jgi:hypothetical protein
LLSRRRRPHLLWKTDLGAHTRADRLATFCYTNHARSRNRWLADNIYTFLRVKSTMQTHPIFCFCVPVSILREASPVPFEVLWRRSPGTLAYLRTFGRLEKEAIDTSDTTYHPLHARWKARPATKSPVSTARQGRSRSISCIAPTSFFTSLGIVTARCPVDMIFVVSTHEGIAKLCQRSYSALDA